MTNNTPEESELFVRQSNFYSPQSMNQPVTIVGCGALGGFIACALTKMGVKSFTLYDDDIVAPHNIANQPFMNQDIDSSKVAALSEMIKEMSPFERSDLSVAQHEKKWDKNDALRRGLIINSADSITVRRDVFNSSPAGSFIIDVRSGPDSYDVFFCDTGNPRMTAFYAGTFFDPSNAVGNGCGAQSVVWCGMQVAALAANGWMRHCNRKPLPVHVSGSLHNLHVEQLYPNGEVNWNPPQDDE